VASFDAAPFAVTPAASTTTPRKASIRSRNALTGRTSPRSHSATVPGPLGQTFAAEQRHVLLIDEIDKADIEFPNDLLRELDEMRFSIVETSEEIIARHRPVVMITSNNEKELPDAFLRRCIFHYIEFPDPGLMRKIIAVHHPHLDAKLLDQVLIKFYWLREQNELRKKPSTAELVDWISALLRSGMSMEKIEAHIPRCSRRSRTSTR